MKTLTPPAWLANEPALLGLLHRFVDRLDEGPGADPERRLSLRLTRRHCPELHADRQEAEYTWSLIRSLDKQYQIWSIKGPRAKPGEPDFEKIRLEFHEEAEVVVRAWLQRPLIDPYALIWREAIEKHAAYWPDSVRFLVNSPLRHESRPAGEVIQALIRFAGMRDALTLREASARCFWGDSKFAENRETWLRDAFPGVMQRLLPRPVLLNVLVPSVLDGVLWVENQDVFLRFAHQPPPEATRLALIYAAGFRASSPRIREPGQVVFCAVHTEREAQSPAPLVSLWQGSLQLPCYFFGDLDFAGMRILGGLRLAFPEVEAWVPGYSRLLEALQAGFGHRPDETGKDAQGDPQLTGCGYADHVLLPALRRSGLAVDQEFMSGVSAGVG